MKKITAYKTTDGKVFEDESEAVRHESESIVRTNISKILLRMKESEDISLCTVSDAIDDMVDFIVTNRQDFRNALRGDVYI